MKKNNLIKGQIHSHPNILPKSIRYLFNSFIAILILSFIALLFYALYLRPFEIIILFIVFFLAFWLILRNAPEGYQDQEGFHETGKKKEK